MGLLLPKYGIEPQSMPGWNFLSWKGLAHLMRAGKSDLSRQGEKLWWRGKRADPSGSEKLSCQIDVSDTSPRLETSCAVPVPSLAWLETASHPGEDSQMEDPHSWYPCTRSQRTLHPCFAMVWAYLCTSCCLGFGLIFARYLLSAEFMKRTN